MTLHFKSLFMAYDSGHGAFLFGIIIILIMIMMMMMIRMIMIINFYPWLVHVFIALEVLVGTSI